jgi:hypothetical protein
MTKIENRMMGAGCFARQPTLSRVLDRMMEAYSLGAWKDALGAHEKASPENLVLQTLISGISEMDGPHEDGRTGEKIAGFFLTFENQRINLSVFTRRQGRRGRKYTASLEEISRLRRSRLN